MPEKRITLKDIAREAGVSVSAVSLALRNNPAIPEATRLRIQDAAKTLGYTPDPALAALGAHRNAMKRDRVETTLAYLDTRDPAGLPPNILHRSEYLSGARRRGAELGYKIDVFWMQREAAGDGMKASRILRARGIRGVMIAPFQSAWGELNLDWQHFCAVSLGRSMGRPLLHAVSHDHSDAVGLAIRELLEHGYRRPGLALEPTMNARVSQRWLAGYLVEQQTRIAPEDRIPPFIDEISPPASIHRWLKKHRPDVVLSIGGGTPELIQSAGLRIPDDIGFVHLDSHEKEISGIVQDMPEVGALAVECIHRSLLANEFGLPRSRQLTLLAGHWREGRTIRKIESP